MNKRNDNRIDIELQINSNNEKLIKTQFLRIWSH